MRKKLNSFGMTLFVAALVIPIILMISELQAWTAHAFQDVIPQKSALDPVVTETSGGYTDPAVMLNLSGTTAEWLSILAVVAALGAAAFLLGQRRLLAISVLWLTLGVCLNGHLYAELDEGAWLVLAAITATAAFLPEYGIFRKQRFPDAVPAGDRETARS